MNILFMTLNSFSSLEERGIYTDLLREFSKKGHNVHVITPIEKRKNEETELITEENARILRLKVGNIQKTNIIEKGISTVTLENKYIKGIKKYFSNIKFDLIIYSTPPITLQKAVKFVKKRDNAKTYLLLKDIFPQNALDLGILHNEGIKSVIYRYFRNKETNLYDVSDYIGCMSQANVDYVLKNNPKVNKNKVEICPNSIEPVEIKVTDLERKMIREKYQIPLDKTIFLYGGNLGKPQGIDFLIESIQINETNEKSFFLIVGSGTEYSKLVSFFQKTKPENAKLLSHLPKEDFELLTNSCDVGMLFLDKRFTIPNFPSRVLSYMNASLPVLAATDVNTDVGEIIEENDFGFWCKNGDLNRFNELVNRLCEDNIRIRLGNTARKYLEKNYTAIHSFEIIMKHFSL